MTITFNRRQFLAGSVYVATALALSSCSGGAESSESAAEPEAKEEVKEYIDESEIDAMFTDPDSFKGKWVKLPGRTLGSSERDGDVTGLQAYYDITTYDRSYIVSSSTTERFSDGEYIFVDGKIEGILEGENAFGASLSLPYITEATITKSSYMDVVVPTVASVEPEVSATQNDVSFTCEKVEFADAETRVYLTVSNGSSQGVSMGVYDIRIIADGQQIEQDNSSMSVYEGGYPELSYDISAGASTNGILVFPSIEPGTAFKLVVPDIYSDDYEVTFTDVELEIPAE